MLTKRSGFTLVEVAVVTPILILVATGLIVGLVLMANNISGPNRQNSLIRNQHQALSALESDIVNSTGFLADNFMTSGTAQIGDYTFSDPNSADYSSPPRLLILKYNLSQNPSDTGRTIPSFINVPYPSGNPCSPTTITDENNTEPIIIVYYVKTETDSGKTLYRRTLTASRSNPSIDALGPECLTKLARRSCQQVTPPTCNNQDLRLTDSSGLKDFQIVFYTAPDTLVPISDPTSAQSIQVSLAGGLAGIPNDEAAYTSTARLSRIGN
jgi:hypothetical protein